MTPTLTLVPPAPRIAVEHLGTGPALIFLHGIGGHRSNWRDQLPVFARRFHAMAWDARGYGDSDDYEGDLDFADYSHDLERVLDHFGIERAHICGLSMGGRIAMDFVRLYPDRVRSLTLCDTHLGLHHFSEERKAEFVRLRKEPLVAGKEPKDMAPAVARTLMGPNAPEWVYDRLVDSMSRLHKASYIKSIEASVRSDGPKELERIGVPTHVVCGGGDRLTPPDMAREIARRIPGARLTIIGNAGHLVNIEEPAAFNEAVLAFLAQAFPEG
jgi:3-oxoadipate enol-lactonase